ncbi:MAG TPA: hypothetical protein VII41_16800, partial [Steroidobacteraceae bacterium]
MAVVAARQTVAAALQRRADARRYSGGLAAIAGPMAALFFGLGLAGVLGIATATPAVAQSFTYNPQPPRPSRPRTANDGQMLVQAVEVDYDYNNSRVSAVGNVQMFYNGTSVEADKVIYDQKTKRLHAEGNIRLTDADGSHAAAMAAHSGAPPERGRHSLAGGDDDSHYPSSWYSKAKKPVRPPTNTGSHAAAIGCINSALL